MWLLNARCSWGGERREGGKWCDNANREEEDERPNIRVTKICFRIEESQLNFISHLSDQSPLAAAVIGTWAPRKFSSWQWA